VETVGARQFTPSKGHHTQRAPSTQHIMSNTAPHQPSLSCPVVIPAKSRRDSSLRKKKLSRDSSGQTAAFYAAAQPNQVPLMYFDIKYYGVCHDIPTSSPSPVMVNVTRLLDEKKKNPGALKGQMYFSDKGLAVIQKGSSNPIVSWFTYDIASLASVKHPLKPSRRVALMKVRNPQGALEWHLFKYACGKRDHMSESFRYIVDCSLRDIGRAVATGQHQAVRTRMGNREATTPEMTDPNGSYRRTSQSAWGDETPPKYDNLVDVAQAKGPAPTGGLLRRRLVMDDFADTSTPINFSSDAADEAKDIAHGMRRLSQFKGAAQLYDEPEPMQEPGYLLVEPPSDL